MTTVTPRLRKFALTVHIILSVGWIGAVFGYIALDIAAATSQDALTLRAAYLGMDLIARSVIVPLALASLFTGLVMSLGTKWGLFQHYWVLISLLLTIVATVVLLVETQTIRYFAEMAADPATSTDDLRALGNTLGHSIGGTVVLLVILMLNTYKPQGMTRYGRRKQHEQRAVGPGRESTTSLPSWVYVIGIVVIAFVLLGFAILHLTGGGVIRHTP